MHVIPTGRTSSQSRTEAADRAAWSFAVDAGLELRHLRYFVAVAEELHFGRAAKVLHISQPPLSRQIRDLERFIGVTLFDRSARSVSLTDAGSAFLPEARRILNEVSRSVQLAHRAAIGEIGSLELAVSPLVESGLVSRILEEFSRACPEVTLALHHLSSEEQVHFLRSGSLDAGILLLPAPEMDRLVVEPLFREPVAAVVSRSHPLADRTDITLSELSRHSLVRIEERMHVRCYDHVSRLSTICGVPLRAEQTANSLEEVLRMVRESASVTLLPAPVRELCDDQLRCLRVTDRNADFTFALAFRRSGVSSALSRFLPLARRVAGVSSLTVSGVA